MFCATIMFVHSLFYKLFFVINISTNEQCIFRPLLLTKKVQLKLTKKCNCNVSFSLSSMSRFSFHQICFRSGFLGFLTGSVLALESQSKGQRGSVVVRSPLFLYPLRNAPCMVREQFCILPVKLSKYTVQASFIWISEEIMLRAFFIRSSFIFLQMYSTLIWVHRQQRCGH